MPSQDCCCAVATSTPSAWLVPSGDADNGFQDAASGATVAILGLQPLHLWAHWISEAEQWLEAFCMTSATFQELMEQLRPHLECQDTDMSVGRGSCTCLALTLIKLAMPTSLWYVSHLFGMGKATARETFLEVCGTLQDVLANTMLCMHDPVVVVGLRALGFPQCIRDLDGTHNPITCLSHGVQLYYS
ncbi:hypothetical protein Y1Q_0002292 [Alligator mississippiensis]|uniref:Uncharacterized protein n=1 Tax=Alligator mississippiensis TaxID=8496 RepID=A0A151MGM6_ALLMI|nr:hypothetical protein Y1Q_0002292 [Alligator mississippiensis]